jgi:small subunit ribosomal protein S2
LRAFRFLTKLSASGSQILFVGTKRQAKDTIETEARRCGMPFVSERWLGGTLTNHRTIRDRLKRLAELEAMWLPSYENPAKVDLVAYIKTMLNESGKLDIHKAPETSVIRSYSKKMISNLSRELTKIQRNLSGIREMHRLPDALVIVDPRREHIAIKEAKRMGIATVALIDTDSDPDDVDLPIPANDDSIRSVELVLAKLADAIIEGRAALATEQATAPRPRPAPSGTAGTVRAPAIVD